MNREDIIRMAREAAFSEPAHPFITWGASDEQLERFAALVATAEREACAKVCERIANDLSAWPSAYEGVNAETKLVRKMGEVIGQPFIEAIRARGNHAA